ncbi:unnamed protein product [Peronospora effusa]|nr:unnamed protein product [Peronospora effusa]
MRFCADADAEIRAADDSLGWDGPLGVGLPIVDPLAPVLDSDESPNESFGAPRGASYLGADVASDGATPGTGISPAAPIAQKATARGDPSGDQAPTRSSSATSRRFEDRAADGRPLGQPISTPGPLILVLSIGGGPRG